MADKAVCYYSSILFLLLLINFWLLIAWIQDSPLVYTIIGVATIYIIIPCVSAVLSVWSLISTIRVYDNFLVVWSIFKCFLFF
jgi:hypothetical protein